ncbi:MAG: hypothetical protein IJU91_03355 [Selenomonadaceae bacterium]|nr:hypothetical protein [Selenomonadaceae bacterium]
MRAYVFYRRRGTNRTNSGNHHDGQLFFVARHTDRVKKKTLGGEKPFFYLLQNLFRSELEENKMSKLFGEIEISATTDLTKLPQKAASSLAVIEDKERVGARFKCLAYVGKQVVRGTNYWFIAEETMMTAGMTKHIVAIAVNEYQGEYEIVKSSIIPIF